jgi:hypothetical protein
MPLAVMLTTFLAHVPAAAAPVFSPSATFDLEAAVATSPSASNGPGGYNPGNPLVITNNGITLRVSRHGGEDSFDVKDLDARFPLTWGDRALDPFVNAGDGTDPSPFFLSFDQILGAARIQVSDLSSAMGEVDTIHIKAFKGSAPSSAQGANVIPYISVNGDPNAPSLSFTTLSDGTIVVSCSPSQCGKPGSGAANFLQIQLDAAQGEYFRSILFRGFGTVDDDAIQDNSMYADMFSVATGIPEPGTAALAAAGAALVFGLARWRRE